MLLNHPIYFRGEASLEKKFVVEDKKKNSKKITYTQGVIMIKIKILQQTKVYYNINVYIIHL